MTVIGTDPDDGTKERKDVVDTLEATIRMNTPRTLFLAEVEQNARIMQTKLNLKPFEKAKAVQGDLISRQGQAVAGHLLLTRAVADLAKDGGSKLAAVRENSKARRSKEVNKLGKGTSRHRLIFDGNKAEASCALLYTQKVARGASELCQSTDNGQRQGTDKGQKSQSSPR